MNIEELKEILEERITRYDSIQYQGWYACRGTAITISNLLYENKELLHQKVTNYATLRKQMQATFYPEDQKYNSEALGELFHKLLDELTI